MPFSVGGPLYRMLSRTYLTSSLQELVRRQAAICVLVSWVPLAVLSLVQGHFSGGVRLSFLRDIETHVRFLVSLPLLILGEILVNQRLWPVMNRFVEQELVAPEEVSTYYRAADTSVRLHNSRAVDVLLIVFVFTGGIWFWHRNVAPDVLSWFAFPQGGQAHLTLAGYWLAYVSVPIFQFIILRWYIGILIWFCFLFRVARLKLDLLPLHPDRAGGLGFLGGTTVAFAPLLFAQGALLAGTIAGSALYHHTSVLASETTILGYVVLSLLVILGPQLLFSLHLMDSKRRGLAKYGALASQYVRGFGEKWLQRADPSESLLGNADIQSLADLGNSFTVVREMRPVPFSLDDVILLLVAILAPLLPLLLTIFSVHELILRVIKFVL